MNKYKFGFRIDKHFLLTFNSPNSVVHSVKYLPKATPTTEPSSEKSKSIGVWLWKVAVRSLDHREVFSRFEMSFSSSTSSSSSTSASSKDQILNLPSRPVVPKIAGASWKNSPYGRKEICVISSEWGLLIAVWRAKEPPGVAVEPPCRRHTFNRSCWEISTVFHCST